MKEFYKNHKLIRILMWITLILLTIILIFILILNFFPPLGGKITVKDKKEYEKRALNYIDGKFHNEEDFELIYKSTENIYLSTKNTKPERILKVEKPELLENPKSDDLTVTWLGHSSTLIQMSGLNILIDPMFSEYSSPLQFVGPKRFSELPLEIDELTTIDIVLITHDHYDHLDYNTIKKLKDKTKKFIVPLGVEKHLQKWGVTEETITNLAWWEETNINDLKIVCTPAQHYSNRSINDRNNTLWASFVLKNDYYQIFQSGDTGYNRHFKEIYEKYGSFDLVLLDSGQYNNSWKQVHMTPEESVTASIDLHAKVAMPIHWGTFSLAMHPWDDSVERFMNTAKEKELTAITPKIGNTVNYKDYSSYTDYNWWKDIK